jgi:hypothetical protein
MKEAPHKTGLHFFIKARREYFQKEQKKKEKKKKERAISKGAVQAVKVFATKNTTRKGGDFFCKTRRA